MEEPSIVHVIDDDAMVREAIESLLLSMDQLARSHASAADFLDRADLHGAGCVLADIRLPRMGGLELQARLTAQGCALPVILMSAHADIPMTVRGMKAGAVDFLIKPLREQDILDAVDIALARNRADRSRLSAAACLTGAYATLSGRERQVMALISAGNRNRDIAATLSLSEITVKTHRSSAMRKMGARNTQELVRLDHELQRLGVVAS